MSTKKLAKELGLVRQRSKSSSVSKKSIANQVFSYLIVIDFESTCWKEKNNHGQEIIEFPAVLLNTSTGEIESEFHTYVQPQEHPILSDFCSELTGITQVQVEAGVPLQICLSQFSRWVNNLKLEKEVVFPSKQQSSALSPSQKLCTFLTWSDWDLGVCLQYECKRKQLHKPGVLNSWIDLRSTYRLFYSRKPKGLNGALQDLGIQFSGREHSGLDDSRNTARLAARMMMDGCIMKITRSLERAPVVVNSIFGKTTSAAENKKEKPSITEKENKPSTRKPLSTKTIHRECQRSLKNNVDLKENSSSAQDSVQTCHSLISPKTLLNSTTSTLWGRSRRSMTVDSAARLPSGGTNNINSLVLCSTTVNCISSPLQSKPAAETGILSGPEEDEYSGEFLVETEERCGSYDDVVLEGGDDTDGTHREYDSEFITEFDGPFESKELDEFTAMDTMRKKQYSNVEIVQKNSDSSSNFKSVMLSIGNVNSSHNKTMQRSSIMESETCFAVPKSITRHKTVSEKHPQLQERAGWSQKICKTKPTSSVQSKPFVPVQTSTPFARPKPVTTQHLDSFKSPFPIYTDPTNHTRAPTRPSVGGSLHSLHNITNSSFNSRSYVTAKRVQRVTSPLCACGRRAKRQVVSNGGPNHGQGFFCCPVRRSGGSNGRVEKGCQFFKWESALIKSCSVASPSVGASTSFFQINSTCFIHPPNKSSLRKSY